MTYYTISNQGMSYVGHALYSKFLTKTVLAAAAAFVATLGLVIVKPDALYFLLGGGRGRRDGGLAEDNAAPSSSSHLSAADSDSFSYVHSPVTSQFSNLTVISSGEELINIFNVSSFRRNLEPQSADVKLIFFKPDLSLLEDIARTGHLCLHSSQELQDDEEDHQQGEEEPPDGDTSDSSADVWFDVSDSTPALELGGSHPQ